MHWHFSLFIFIPSSGITKNKSCFILTLFLEKTKILDSPSRREVEVSILKSVKKRENELEKKRVVNYSKF